MQSLRVRSERLLEAALESLSRALTESKAPWMVIGGIAIIARGVRRFTTDIDAAVRGDAIRPEALLAICVKNGILPRIPDALRFAQANLVLLLRHESTGVDLDVSFAWSAFEHDALAACTLTGFGRVRAPMCTAEDLVVFKAIAGRARDIEDAEALLGLFPEIDLERVRRRVTELSVLAEAPELLESFEAIASKQTTTPRAHEAAVTRPARKKARRTPKRK
jgi:hypothetical protein